MMPRQLMILMLGTVSGIASAAILNAMLSSAVV